MVYMPSPAPAPSVQKAKMSKPVTDMSVYTQQLDVTLHNRPYITYRPSFRDAQGYPLYQADVDKFVAKMQAHFDTLPADPYAEKSNNRSREYRRCIVLPWENPMRVYWIPAFIDEKGQEIAFYNQGKFNPEHADERRALAAIPDHMCTPMLEQIIISNVQRCEWDGHEVRHPIIVGVHFIKTAPTTEHPVSKTTPNALHQDGHKFSCVTLIKRHNAEGGENVITAHAGKYAGLQPFEVPVEDIMTRFYLQKPLDSWAAYDKKVAHYAGPVMQADPALGTGERSVMICDIEPMVAAVCPI